MEHIYNINKTVNRSTTTSQHLMGKAIFNNSLIDYLVDSGAACTVINNNLIQQIQSEDPTTQILPYHGKNLYSANNPINIDNNQYNR